MRRIVEMAVCYTDGTWRAGFFAEIDDDPGCDCTTVECMERNNLARLEALGQKRITEQLSIHSKSKSAGPDIAHIWLYNSSMDDAVRDDPE